MECNGINKVAKRCNTKYTCKKCDYNTSRKSQFNRHLLTAKHKNNENTTIIQQNTTQKSTVKHFKIKK